MKDLAYLREYYKEFLDDCCAHGLDFFETKNRDNFYEWGYNGTERPDYVFCSSGATKMVLWDEQMPYVIKVPFLDERNGFRDYCEIELAHYKEAYRFPEIINCFAWVDFLFNYKGHPIYIMEKIDCDESGISDAAYDSSFVHYCEVEGLEEGSEEYEDARDNFADSFFDWWEGLEQIEVLFCDSWGGDVFDNFREFCNFYNINDLHCGNWGWRGSELVVVDYSGI